MLKYGYVIVKNIFSEKQILQCRSDIIKYHADNLHLVRKCKIGTSITNFTDIQELRNVSMLKETSKLLEVLDSIFETKNYRYCSHNDIGINRVMGWHKDKLNDKYTIYELQNIWKPYKEEVHEIYKVLIYLQNTQNELSPKLISKSHKNIGFNDITNDDKNVLTPELNMGDVLIIDTRLTHKGLDKEPENDVRILVSFAFGKNNIFTDNFQTGTIVRQNKHDITKN